jgi:hypothetical protein
MAKQWSHGDIPTAADLNAYSTSLAALYAASDAYNSNPALFLLINESEGSGVGGATYLDHEAFFRLIHLRRYLHYKGAGVIQDPAGLADDVTLTEPSAGFGVVDLDSILWLTYGAAYNVSVEGCIELDED